MFDADYYERGVITGRSCYENYRWIPELTVPMAMTMVDYLHIERGARVLDYGCAKGFLVKALRWLHRDAWGYDISEYAIANADPEIRPYVSTSPWEGRDDFCIAKDVFEHVPEDELVKVMAGLRGILFAVIPLGENGQYRAKANNLDVTHVLCMPEEWWVRFFMRCGWHVCVQALSVPGIKDRYAPGTHGFFVCQN